MISMLLAPFFLENLEYASHVYKVVDSADMVHFIDCSIQPPYLIIGLLIHALGFCS